jgi:ribbon-helix-helix protein
MLLIYKKDGEMSDTPRKSYINTTITSDLLTSLKVLAAQQGKRLNMLLEEAIRDLLKKYEKKTGDK